MTSPTERFDIVVIGAGPAGEKAGAQAAYFGRRVAIVDRRGDPGGSAASKTGVPTKTLREAALYLTGFRRRDLYGAGMDLSHDAVLERMRARTAEVVKLSVEAVRRNIERHGIELVQGGGAPRARNGPISSSPSPGERNRPGRATKAGRDRLDRSCRRSTVSLDDIHGSDTSPTITRGESTDVLGEDLRHWA